jgi:RNA 2',3'-cyclic 3'-phosphodiesterase
MRIFYAVDPDEHMKELIWSRAARIGDHLMAGRAIDVFNLHVTVEYIGEADNGRMQEYIRILDKAAADVRPFEIRLKEISSFKQGPSHLIYLKAEHNSGLEKIRNVIIRELIFPFTLYIPHITLFRDALLKDGFTMEKISDKVGFEAISFPVSSVSLMESRRINGKLVYITLYERKI